MRDPADPCWDFIRTRPHGEVMTLLDLASAPSRVPIGPDGARYVLSRLAELGVQDGSADSRTVVDVVDCDGARVDLGIAGATA